MFGYADRTTERLKGNFVALSMQKFSSNVVEKILNNASIGKVRDIINEIVEDPNVLELFEDCFGNFVIQKALTTTVKWPNNIFDAIAEVIENNYSTLDCHMYGKNVTICFTKLRNERRSSYRLANLEAPSNEIEVIFGGIKDDLIEVSMDSNGKYVVGELLSVIDVFLGVILNCEALAKDKHGCRLLQKCLECADQSRMYKLMDEIIKKASCLTRDQYGFLLSLILVSIYFFIYIYIYICMYVFNLYGLFYYEID
ncbi:hypothetical protein Scep_001126 [Stephania cephalantha]|uniref:PUM-HD domain-containing protein n=1 Tax=Stephania cephalantha TaxID=152367 RepID=A0AAP0L8G7_9MAGN